MCDGTQTAVVKVTWEDVQEVLHRVEEVLGVDDANLLRAALAMRACESLEGLRAQVFRQVLSRRDWGEAELED